MGKTLSLDKNKKINLDDYQEITLRELQNIFVIRFKEIHDFLIEHNIRYFAIGGTALGAIRHKGFIPWDDDMDLGMIREDYNRFLEIAHLLNPRYYKVYNYKNTRKIEHGLTKICLVGTYCGSRNLKDGYDTTYHIDIFPFDVVPPNERKKRKQAKKIKRLASLLYFKSRNKSSKLYKTFFLRILQFALIPFSCRFLIEAENKEAQKYNYYCKENVCNMLGVYSYEKETIPIKMINNPVLVQFEGVDMFVPNFTNEYLAHLYGLNYMVPINRPPNKNNTSFLSKDYFIA